MEFLRERLILYDFDVFVENLDSLIIHLADEYAQGVITSAPIDHVIKILEERDINRRFLDVYGNNRGVDATGKIQKFLEFSGHHPTKAIFVTDNTANIIAARKALVPSIAVTWGRHNEEALLEARPVSIVSTMEELESAIYRFVPSCRV